MNSSVLVGPDLGQLAVALHACACLAKIASDEFVRERRKERGELSQHRHSGMRAKHAGPESITTAGDYGFSGAQLRTIARDFVAPPE
jgi:hypothetical protein